MKRFFPVVSRDGPSKRQKDEEPVCKGETDLLGPSATGAVAEESEKTSDKVGIGGASNANDRPSTGGSLLDEKKDSKDEQNLASIFRRAKSFGAGTAEAPSTSGYERTGKSPTSFMSWNTNSFIIRMKANKQEVVRFVEQHDPDVIAIQEVRLPAAGEKKGPKNRGDMSDVTNSARDEKQFMTRALAAAPFSNYRVFWSLADGKYSGTALLVKKEMEIVGVAYCFDDILTRMVAGEGEPASGRKGPKHEEEGRLIMVEFPEFRLLNTYGMNNGWKEETFQRRRDWDRRLLELVQALVGGKPLIWCGDTNVSHTDLDVSHPEFFRWQKEKGYTPPRDVDVGQPGFTQAEKDRFSEILEKGRLVDSYRHLHPKKDYETGFTWSGHPVGKYRGKRMRIDYFLLSESLVDRLESSEIHGTGIEREGFMGSDHCPITLRLREKLVHNA
ncbi:putative endonuclease/exonuclease/phosphatase family domain containing protein [Klebsormidium nitens]|uniref:DNA-(apurinic or apyrimidinic site) endonuclease n=1 Tax=Klebsormidium nitens TaxID=105231 RepID=A0A1Y1I964_KLENI|nr:putative endonuclease/exonuclease/phosphatase family domain containing protein [Klebsormidium nitens]|eukprot:GAQ85959.1 putative endonuclease/exonuclease/phosphatase family domain containing protein [Klebsormidium nitens]